MSTTSSDGLSRRLVLGALAAMPALPGLLEATAAQAQTGAPLASWNDGPAKQAILDFVRVTTDSSSKDFVPPEERIAEFDQDGTLWVEHPVYTQIVFCLEHVPDLVKAKPELKDREPFKTVLSGDREAIAKLSMRDFFEIVLGTQSGMDVEAFREISRKWLAEAKHPRWDRLYTELVYQPMIEVLNYLRANGYRTFIATGGSAGFVREYSGKVYGIPPQQVAGTEQAFKYGYDKDNMSRSMLDTPQRYPRAGSQSYPSPAAEAAADGSTTVYFSPTQPEGVARGNWIQTVPGKGWFTILRLYSPLEPFFTKEWRPSEVELVR